MEECFVVTGKGCGKMIETCIIKVACVYGVTVAVSFITILSLCLVILFNKRIQKTATDRFGLDEFFKSGHSTQKSWFLIFVPILNLVVAFLCVLAVFTDWGD